MAKQKTKVPAAVSRRQTPDAGDAPVSPVPASKAVTKRKVVLKGKLKNARKGKTRPMVDVGGTDMMGAPPRQKGKATRKKSASPGVAHAVTDSLVAKVFESFQGALPIIKRSRKPVRPTVPLGRLERLEIALGEVRVGGRASVRTRKLLASGVPKMAQKVIEEAAEAAIEAIRGDHAGFVNESVDLFYNLLALASEIGVPLAAIWAEMDRREQSLGMAEKMPKAPDL
jgi:phosphoribosyl-ATP pyrophosphohydrolase